ncbi:HYC_CC_PP family protein [Puia sp. P3]|uniref:HYC_CC_PP family protein n=1 Tax=Puia sp. P3 TaxID=3423952 RepID=UPI003D66D71A
MKKVFVSILAILYLSTSMGATVHLHYCMGRLVAWGLMDKESRDCVSCGMSKSEAMPGCSVGMKNCCHDEHMHFQNDPAQKLVQSWVEWNLAPALVVMPYQGWNEPVVIAPAIDRPVAHGPPLSGKVPVFLRNCSFRI